MDVNQLQKIIDSPGANAEERRNAIDELRRMSQGGASGLECKAAREALAVLNERQEFPEHASLPVLTGLEQELLSKTGIHRLGDIEYSQVHSFCTARNWSPEAMALYEKWAANNIDCQGTILKLYLSMHHQSRTTAKHLLKNFNTRRWPNHWIDRKALEGFLQTSAQCKDADLVIREFLDKGTLEHWDRPPRTCECNKLADAITLAAKEKNPQILIDYLADTSKAA